MTWAVNHPHRRQRTGTAGWASARTTTRPVRVPWVGLFIALLGAWAGIVAFVGPAFGYNATTTSSWQWTTTNWLLHLIPGAMALVAGLMILGWAPSWVSVKARGALAFAALLAIVAGAWLVIGPALWPWFQSSAAYGPATDAQTSFINQVGANLGPGVLLAMLGGMALKTAMSAPRMAGAVEPVGGEPVADDDGDYPARGREGRGAPGATDRTMTGDPAAGPGAERRATDRGFEGERGYEGERGVTERGTTDRGFEGERGFEGDREAAPRSATAPDETLPPA